MDQDQNIISNNFSGRHSLHKEVGRVIKEYFDSFSGYTVILDPACDTTPKQNIPLFLEEVKGNDSEITNVDIMVVKEDKVVLICEIEESNVKPNHIIGKFFSVALSKYWSKDYKNKAQELINLGNDIVFIQVLDTSKLVIEKSKKPSQWRKIKHAIIQKLIEPNLFNCKEYDLIYGQVSNIKDIESELLNVLKQFI